MPREKSICAQTGNVRKTQQTILSVDCSQCISDKVMELSTERGARYAVSNFNHTTIHDSSRQAKTYNLTLDVRSNVFSVETKGHDV